MNEFDPAAGEVFLIFETQNINQLANYQHVTNVIHNFNSGPSILPAEVFEEASRSVIDFNNTGLSILEIGHRTALFQEVIDEARSLAKELMKLDDDHEVSDS